MTATTLDQHAPVGAPPHKHRSVWLRAGWIRAAWMTALFWGIGLGLVLIFRWWAGWEPLFKWDVITVVATLTAAPIGFSPASARSTSGSATRSGPRPSRRTIRR